MDFVGEDVASEVSISAGNPAPNSVATKEKTEADNNEGDRTGEDVSPSLPLCTSTPYYKQQSSSSREFPAFSPVEESQSSALAAGDATNNSEEKLLAVAVQKELLFLENKKKLEMNCKEINHLRGTVGELESEDSLEKSKAEVLKLQNQIDNFPPKSNRLVETAKEQKAVVVDSETQMDKTFRDIVQEQADMLLKEKARDLQLEREELEKRLNDKEYEWSRQLEELRSDSTVKEELYQRRVDDYEARITELMKKKKAAEEEKEVFLKNETAHTKKEVEWREEKKALQDVLDRCREELRKCADLKSSYEELQNLLKTEESKNSELAKTLDAQCVKAKKFQDEVEHLRRKVESNLPHGIAQPGTNGSLEEVIHQLQNEKIIWEQKLDNMTKQLRKTESELASSRAAVAEGQERLVCCCRYFNSILFK
ncbi:unnamed protein product [Enterobius vermicularis]|uniref:Centrosomal protein of 162 kDa n=1 Tax=Enterobius vermicularis TaxID=51028 RepID=A0A158QBF4_ENTVE|nr:unnamed protein product [Enterobius vermicularis]